MWSTRPRRLWNLPRNRFWSPRPTSPKPKPWSRQRWLKTAANHSMRTKTKRPKSRAKQPSLKRLLAMVKAQLVAMAPTVQRVPMAQTVQRGPMAQTVQRGPMAQTVQLAPMPWPQIPMPKNLLPWDLTNRQRLHRTMPVLRTHRPNQNLKRTLPQRALSAPAIHQTMTPIAWPKWIRKMKRGKAKPARRDLRTAALQRKPIKRVQTCPSRARQMKKMRLQMGRPKPPAMKPVQQRKTCLKRDRV